MPGMAPMPDHTGMLGAIGRCMAVLPSIVNFRSSIVRSVTRSKPQKVKKMWVSTPSPRAALRHDQDRVGHVQVALGRDEDHLAGAACTGRRRREVARAWPWHWGGRLQSDAAACVGRAPPKSGMIGVSIISVIGQSLLDAALGLGQPGDVGHLLGGFAGEEPGTAPSCRIRRRGDAAQRRGLLARRVVGAQEPQHLPVLVGQLVDAGVAGQDRRRGPRPTDCDR